MIGPGGPGHIDFGPFLHQKPIKNPSQNQCKNKASKNMIFDRQRLPKWIRNVLQKRSKNHLKINAEKVNQKHQKYHDFQHAQPLKTIVFLGRQQDFVKSAKLCKI